MNQAVALHGPRDLRLIERPDPNAPGKGEVTVAVSQVGVCGSDLHFYQDGRIGEIVPEGPIVLGHEFAGRAVAVGGDEAVDGTGKAIAVGERVAVDPQQPCGKCELCKTGHPNLCPHHTFVGVWPTQGALQQQLNVPADTCFVLPDEIDDEQAALLEPLGVAIQTIDLAHIRPGYSVAIIGGGPIGLCCVMLARLAGAQPIWVSEPIDWRMKAATKLGGSPRDAMTDAHRTRGVDVAIEAAWSSEQTLAAAVDALRPGGRLVVVGISDDDRIVLEHSSMRRKGITMAMVRRMAHTYPRAMSLLQARPDAIDFQSIISHRLPLAQTDKAFELASSYSDGVIKMMVQVSQ